MPAITCWSRSTACSGRGASSSSCSCPGAKGSGHASGPSEASASSSNSSSVSQQLHPSRLLGAELAQPQLARALIARSGLDPHEQPRGPVARPGELVVELQPAGRHQVDQQRQRADRSSTSTIRCLPRRRTASIRWPSSAVSGGSKCLQRVDPRREHRGDRRAGSAPSSRRAVISTSGSSGIGTHRRAVPGRDPAAVGRGRAPVPARGARGPGTSARERSVGLDRRAFVGRPAGLTQRTRHASPRLRRSKRPVAAAVRRDGRQRRKRREPLRSHEHRHLGRAGRRADEAPQRVAAVRGVTVSGTGQAK